ncbi:MGMT family protein [Glycomyces buryatensis]|nr:MGMT family protein [Glycomyces buryatensis]
MIPIEISERLYRYIQQRAVPLEDSVDSVLTRLLGLDDDTSSTTPSTPNTSSATKGALAPLIRAGLLREGDDLRWNRTKKGVAYSAKVGPDGTIRLESGQLADSPSGAAVAVANGNHPGWNVWVHVDSGLSLAELRSQVAPVATEPVPERPTWQSQLGDVLGRLPHGTWTSYGDLGRLLGRNPRELGNYLGTTKVLNAHRVLQHNGRISPSFRWIEEDRGDIREVLRREGVFTTSSEVAPPESRLHVEDLRELKEGV